MLALETELGGDATKGLPSHMRPRTSAASDYRLVSSNRTHEMAPLSRQHQPDGAHLSTQTYSPGSLGSVLASSSGTRPLDVRSPIANTLVDGVVRDDTDALHLLFNTALRPGSREEEAPATTAHSQNEAMRKRNSTQVNKTVAVEASYIQRSTAASATGDGGTQQSSSLQTGSSPLDSRRSSVWSYFRPCQQNLLSPAEAEAYFN